MDASIGIHQSMDTGYWFVCSILQVLRLTQRLSRKNYIKALVRKTLKANWRITSVMECSRFQRPYGIAWLLQLTAELRQSDHPQALQWLNNLLPT